MAVQLIRLGASHISYKQARLRPKTEVPPRNFVATCMYACLAGSERDELSSADPTASEHSLTKTRRHSDKTV
jgi:hypothetical protein